MFSSRKLAFNYAIFALIATAVNIGVQDLIVRIYSGKFSILASVIIGTGVGLIIKYILDKRYIFRFNARSVAHDTQTFALYTVMGLVTTLLFWGFEFSFYYFFDAKEMRYVGGIIGLAIGYLTKYQLDKRYVFRMEIV
ncbi:GtrA family protein [Yersinia sp. HM-2024]|uniref:GtrA family protein n=1 Tax=Yersinia sp. HM-2024 TaxID=3344550 RepID=UPI00370D7231